MSTHSNTANNLNHRNSTERLPRLHSHAKLKLSSQAHQPTTVTQEATILIRRPRSQSDLKSARQSLQSANTSKAVRLEATQVVYLKKIQALEKQDYLLEREITKTKGEIQQLRVKRKRGNEETVSSRCSSGMSTVRDGVSMGPSRGSGRAEILRKRVDREYEKMRKTMEEVDKTRRQISTMKKLNIQLQEQLLEWSRQLQGEVTVAADLESKIVASMQALQKKKVEEVQQKAHLLRDYDGILRRLEEELGSRGSTSRQDLAGQLYLTDLPNITGANYSNNSGNTKRKQLEEQSPKSKKLASQTAHLQEQQKLWQQQLQLIQERNSAESIEQIESKLAEQQVEHYKKGKYISQRHDHLQQLKQRHDQLVQRKQQMDVCVEGEKSRQDKERERILRRMEECQESEKKYRGEVQKIEEMYKRLRVFVEQFEEKTGKQLQLEGQVKMHNLSEWLQAVLTSQKSASVVKH